MPCDGTDLPVAAQTRGGRALSPGDWVWHHDHDLLGVVRRRVDCLVLDPQKRALALCGNALVWPYDLFDSEEEACCELARSLVALADNIQVHLARINAAHADVIRRLIALRQSQGEQEAPCLPG